MSWLTFNIDLSRAVSALDRIASALERISPPPLPTTDPPDQPADNATSPPPVFGMSESPEQYEERTSHEAALAISLGVAPWSPTFQRAIAEMREDILKSHIDGQEEPITAEQADDIIRRSFLTAKAEANERRG